MKFYNIIKTAVFAVLSKQTIGVKILLVRDDNVLLVKHTYQPGWATIGGGVDPKEAPRIAIERELQEEVGVTLLSPPELFAVYYSNNEKRDDYIVFYIGKDFAQQKVSSPEIADYEWFSFANLPEDITPATHRRIEEYLGHKKIDDFW